MLIIQHSLLFQSHVHQQLLPSLNVFAPDKIKFFYSKNLIRLNLNLRRCIVPTFIVAGSFIENF
ncbi:hypothetical protein Bhyg_13249 [Pseudolycoriella hygida]|uniref:Uncharacterized protein n=1 Tax=Pseudolycoriella hygida TaxID=35572 RepID=A0A9Q0MQY4_9DIPT|nr:hypothetical protein Bhyg_13249 [Pseudolycoriella hygida]